MAVVGKWCHVKLHSDRADHTGLQLLEQIQSQSLGTAYLMSLQVFESIIVLFDAGLF